MKPKKWITIITFIITVALIPLIICFDRSELTIYYDIALSVFGGSSMGFIMTLVEYFSERRKAMEIFWSEALSVLTQLRKAKYIHFDEPEELILSCIKENMGNRFADKYSDASRKALGIEISVEEKTKYIQWMENNIPMNFSEDDEQDSILEEMYAEAVNKYEDILKNAIENYIELSKISLGALDNAYGNLDFIFGNKTIRALAYKSIYEKLRNIRNKILESAVHFNLWKGKKGNFAVCAKKVLELNHMMFSEEESSSEGNYKLVYQKELDDIDDSLEDFRTKIYFKTKKESIEHVPVFGEMINFEEAENKAK